MAFEAGRNADACFLKAQDPNAHVADELFVLTGKDPVEAASKALSRLSVADGSEWRFKLLDMGTYEDVPDSLFPAGIRPNPSLYLTNSARIYNFVNLGIGGVI